MEEDGKRKQGLARVLLGATQWDRNFPKDRLQSFLVSEYSTTPVARVYWVGYFERSYSTGEVPQNLGRTRSEIILKNTQILGEVSLSYLIFLNIRAEFGDRNPAIYLT